VTSATFEAMNPSRECFLDSSEQVSTFIIDKRVLIYWIPEITKNSTDSRVPNSRTAGNIKAGKRGVRNVDIAIERARGFNNSYPHASYLASKRDPSASRLHDYFITTVTSIQTDSVDALLNQNQKQ